MSAYFEKLKDPRWQRKRLTIMKRDGFKCRDCGSESKSLQVHHCFYIRGDPWDTPDRYLLTLCEECHETRGDLETDGRNALGMIFAGSSPAELYEVVTNLTVEVQAAKKENV